MKLLDQKNNEVWIPPDRKIGEGHEAIVYSVDDDTLAKIYRDPSWYKTADDQSAAEIRLTTHQKKLLAFPNNLPNGAVGPASPLWRVHKILGWQRHSKICGYTMPWIKEATEIDYYMIPRSREEGVRDVDVVRALIRLHAIITDLHKQNFVIGDLNHGNVLVRGPEAWTIDLDAGQFGEYYCNTFEPDYLDPLLMDADPALRQPILRQDKYYSELSDWYSFACMVLACFTYVKPYQGGYDGNIEEARRPLDRLSIFHPKAIFPKYGGARHWDGFLPEDLVTYLSRVFSREDVRGTFPLELLQNLLPGRGGGTVPTFKTKRKYPWPTPKESITADGKNLGLLFETRGSLDPITQIQEGNLRYLYSIDNDYIRDHGHRVIEGESREAYETTGKHRFHFLHGDQTVTVLRGAATLHKVGQNREQFSTDIFGEAPALASNGEKLAWYHNRTLNIAYDNIAEGQVIWYSPFTINMVWLTPSGAIIGYHRNDEKVGMSILNELGSNAIDIDFSTNRPTALRVFEDEDKLWIWSWHENTVQVHRINQNGSVKARFELERKQALNEELVCLQHGAFLCIDAGKHINELVLKRSGNKTEQLARLPFRDVKQLLPHPKKKTAVITTATQIWQLA